MIQACRYARNANNGDLMVGYHSVIPIQQNESCSRSDSDSRDRHLLFKKTAESVAIWAKKLCHPGSAGIKQRDHRLADIIISLSSPLHAAAGLDWLGGGRLRNAYKEQQQNKSGKVCKSYSTAAVGPNRHSNQTHRKRTKAGVSTGHCSAGLCANLRPIFSNKGRLNLQRSSPPVMISGKRKAECFTSIRLRGLAQTNGSPLMQTDRGDKAPCGLASRWKRQMDLMKCVRSPDARRNNW